MGKIFTVFCAIWLFGFLVTVNCGNIDSKKILSDAFISEINFMQTSWMAGRNFHINSELRNLISVTFRREYHMPYKTIIPNRDIPLAFDSRKNWPMCPSIGSVKTQGNCASSHALVASSIFTDRLCLQKNISRASSADQLLTCCKKCGAGCFGGHMEKSFEYMKNIGLVSGGDYKSNYGCRPYNIENCPTMDNSLPMCSRIRTRSPSCYAWKCAGKFDGAYVTDKKKMKEIYAVPSNADIIKFEILKNGPVSSTFTIHEDFFNYVSGIYYHTHGVKVGEFDVKIIGWGETESVPYWIAVNSWGKKWGENGTFKIRLGVNECNIEHHILSGTFI